MLSLSCDLVMVFLDLVVCFPFFGCVIDFSYLFLVYFKVVCESSLCCHVLVLQSRRSLEHSFIFFVGSFVIYFYTIVVSCIGNVDYLSSFSISL